MGLIGGLQNKGLIQGLGFMSGTYAVGLQLNYCSTDPMTFGDETVLSNSESGLLYDVSTGSLMISLDGNSLNPGSNWRALI